MRLPNEEGLSTGPIGVYDQQTPTPMNLQIFYAATDKLYRMGVNVAF